MTHIPTIDIDATVEHLEQPGGDPVVWWLKAGIVVVAVSVFSVALYAVLTGVFNQANPRTVLEARLLLLESVVKDTPTSGKAWRDYCSALVVAGDMQGAKAALAQSKKSVRGLSRRYPLVIELDLLWAQKDYKGVVKKAKKNLAKEAKIKKDHVKLRAREGITILASDISSSVTVDMLVYQARASGALHDWSKAVDALTKALSWDPESSDILVLRGQAHERLGHKRRAKADYRKALRYIPDMQPALEGIERIESE